MLGRNSRDSLSVIGGNTAPDLLRVAQQENVRVGFTLVAEKLATGGSDHMSFEQKGIPALFLHSGLHSDLHRVSDNPDLINNDKVAAAARLAYLTCFRLANDPQRYTFIKP